MEDISAQIDGEYQRTKATLGWRFLYSPARTLDEANTVFLGLNPGGAHFIAPVFSCEMGSAYSKEEWAGYPAGKSPLQRQVLALFDILNVSADEVLAGNIYPIRTQKWKDITNPKMAIEFSWKIWQPILTSRPFRIITMGKDVETVLTKKLLAEPQRSIPTHWGDIKATFYRYSGGAICCLPHLSRFGIFGRGKTSDLETALRQL